MTVTSPTLIQLLIFNRFSKFTNIFFNVIQHKPGTKHWYSNIASYNKKTHISISILGRLRQANCYFQSGCVSMEWWDIQWIVIFSAHWKNTAKSFITNYVTKMSMILRTMKKFVNKIIFNYLFWIKLSNWYL